MKYQGDLGPEKTMTVRHFDHIRVVKVVVGTKIRYYISMPEATIQVVAYSKYDQDIRVLRGSLNTDPYRFLQAIGEFVDQLTQYKWELIGRRVEAAQVYKRRASLVNFCKLLTCRKAVENINNLLEVIDLVG